MRELPIRQLANFFKISKHFLPCTPYLAIGRPDFSQLAPGPGSDLRMTESLGDHDQCFISSSKCHVEDGGLLQIAWIVGIFRVSRELHLVPPLEVLISLGW